MDASVNRENVSALRERSGSFCTNCTLTAFLYELMRDHVPPGTIEGVLNNTPSNRGDWLLTNGWLAQYADDVAQRLLLPSVSMET